MLTKDLIQLAARLEADSFLSEADRLRIRIEALDALDRFFGGAESGEFEGVREVRCRLEAANAALYESIRSEIRRGTGAAVLRELFGEAREPEPGLSFDYRDEVLSGVLQLREPDVGRVRLGPEMVFYQPTPARHILDLIAASAFDARDVFVDLGAGTGHVALLISMLTDARSVGVEVEQAYVACARECAESLELSRVTFVEGDARTADLFGGTVFYLYTPFSGVMLRQVLERLRKESQHRPIRVCTLGPCAAAVGEEAWLEARGMPDAGRIAVFWSRR